MKRKPKQVAARAIEFLPKRFFFVALRETERLSLHQEEPRGDDSDGNGDDQRPVEQIRFSVTSGVQYVSLDDQIASREDPTRSVDELHQTVRFYDYLTGFLSSSSGSSSDRLSNASTSSIKSGSKSAKVHYFYLRRRNVDTETRETHLICRWRLLYLQLSPHEAVTPFEHLQFLFPPVACSVKRTLKPSSKPPVNLLVPLLGFAKGLEMELLGSDLDALRRHVDQQHHGTLEIGATTWITKRLMVFAGPEDARSSPEAVAVSAINSDEAPSNGQEARASPTFQSLAPVLKQQKVILVVRLTKQSCDDSQFTDSGMEVLDPSPPTAITEADNGQAPSVDDSALLRFLHACESTTGAVAVHSSIGSRRAAMYIGCYLMKHLQFTSQEAFGWLSLCYGRSSSSLTLVHRLFLDRMQMRMWRDGDAYRRHQSEETSAAVHPSSADHDDEFLKSTDSLHISIGNISLGRNSLFGTKAAAAGGAANGHSCDQSNTSREPHAPPAHEHHDRYSQQSGTLGAPQQLKQRPLTQGSGGRRPRIQSYYRNGESGVLRADFAQMHKFLHQTGSSSSAVQSSSSLAARVATPPRSADGANSSLFSSGRSSSCLPSVHTSETVRQPPAATTAQKAKTQ